MPAMWQARAAAGAAGRRLRTGASTAASRGAAVPAAIKGAGTEIAWITAHAALYPMGFRPERLPDGSVPAPRSGAEPDHRPGADALRASPLPYGVDDDGTPILLLHGLADNRSIFTVLRRSLRRHGFGHVHTVNYSLLTSDVRTAAARLGEHVEMLCEHTGYDRVHLIAHSMGGLIARYYVQRLGGDARVHTLVTLGTPHGGTHAAKLLPVRLGRQLRPDSDVVEELTRPAPCCRTRFVAIWSDLDQLIYPKRNAQLVHSDLDGRSVLVQGVGHMSLPIDRRVVAEVTRTLSHLHADGTTETRAVTSIHPAVASPVPQPRRPDLAGDPPTSLTESGGSTARGSWRRPRRRRRGPTAMPADASLNQS
jgi:triacylglycerol lipase